MDPELGNFEARFHGPDSGEACKDFMCASMKSYGSAFAALRSEYTDAPQNGLFTFEVKDFRAIDIKIQSLDKLSKQYLAAINKIESQIDHP